MRGVGLLVLVVVLAAGCSGGGKDSSPASGSPAPGAGAGQGAGSPAGPGDGTGDGAGPATSPGPAGTATPPLSNTDPPTLGPPRPPKRPTDNLKPITTSGTIRLSPGCIDLVTNSDIIWSLLGAVAKDLKDGDQVRVTGQPAVQLESACRGSPLAVLTATKM